MNPNGCSFLWRGNRSAGTSTGRPHSLRSAEASLRSWRLPDLFFPPGFSDGRDRLEPRRPSPAGVRAPHRASALCSAREAVALLGHPLCPSIVALQQGIPQLPIRRPVGYLPIPPAGSIILHCPPRWGGRRREAPGGGGRLRGGARPPLRARSVVRSTTRRALPADDDRRVPSRSWSPEVPDRKKRSGRRHERWEARLAKWSESGMERSARGAGLGRPERVWSAGGGSKLAAYPCTQVHSGYRTFAYGSDHVQSWMPAL